ncbi:hypothetical protein OBBRIDRAFT_173310 [Obba rivulosa]|uniref:Uncharacterized protein n=1 Tax=Obba rivulosa TaxID=1052685 RepID=A0A8E2AM78_9APHY|nr:hypothetical protein OBBRIDRAFT_173310 [Obba rivulosa]
MGATWPRLAALTLCLGGSTGVSTAAFADFARQCPVLTLLELPNIQVPSADLSYSDGASVRAHPLKRMAVRTYSGDPGRFAAFSENLFPDVALTHLEYDDEDILEALDACLSMRDVVADELAACEAGICAADIAPQADLLPRAGARQADKKAVYRPIGVD